MGQKFVGSLKYMFKIIYQKEQLPAEAGRARMQQNILHTCNAQWLTLKNILFLGACCPLWLVLVEYLYLYYLAMMEKIELN